MVLSVSEDCENCWHFLFLELPIMEFEDFTCIHEAKFKDGRFIFKYDFEEHKNSYASGILNNYIICDDVCFKEYFPKSAEHNQRNTSKRDLTNSP